MQNIKLSIFSLLFLSLISCKTAPEKTEEVQEKTATPSTAQHEDWRYAGEMGPEHWTEFEKNSNCDGKFQSPINLLTKDVVKNEIQLKITDYQYVTLTHIHSVNNNGHSIQYNFSSEDNAVIFDKEKYTLRQFHFHSPSEHTINGIRYPLEIHLVHYNDEKRDYLVIAAMAVEGESNETFVFLEQFLPISVGETKPINTTHDFNQLIPENNGAGYFYYKGSLTTPPCTENVNWLIMTSFVTVSETQIELLRQLMPIDNYRDVQHLNGRQITTISD